MSKVAVVLRSNLAYEFFIVGVVWAVVAVELGLVLILWPVLTCLAAGLLLKFWPSGRITWPWANSSAVLGFLVSGYQACVAIFFVSGTFSLVAIATLVAFVLFALVHLMLLYAGYSPAGKPAK